MDEKEKNKGKPAAFSGCLKYLFALIGITIASIAVLSICPFFYSELEAQMTADCSDLPEPIEWSGVVDFEDAPESSIRITEENASRLEPLGTTNLNYELPDRILRVIHHPQHDYVLDFKTLPVNGGSIGPRLVICSRTGAVLRILSDTSYDMAFSPDGQYFARNSIQARHFEIYNAETLELHGRIEFEQLIPDFAFHPSEPLLAVLFSHWRGTDRLEIWNYESLERLAAYDLGSDERQYYSRIFFNKEGTLLAIRTDVGPVAWGIAPE